MHLFFSTKIQDKFIELDTDESRHLLKSLRLEAGERVSVIDGKGNWYNCKVLEPHPKKTLLAIENKEKKDEVFGVEIAAAPTKNLNRWEWFLEKSTEIGIDAIHPILSFHSERKTIKRERQEKILVSAMKQSYKARLPQLSDLEKFKVFLRRDFKTEKYIAHCYEDLPREELQTIHPKGKKALILIGPEGDFSREEIELAEKSGFKSVIISKSRLRTETAALVACHTINLMNA